MKILKWKVGNDSFFLGLIILVCLVFLFPLFHPGFYNSHDGEAHVARFAAYYQAFQDGQFPPRWAGKLNFGYGTPIFIFYYPLPGYLASAIHFLGINFENSYKILMMTSFIVAPMTFYFWAKLLFKKEVAFVGALLYGLAPYHLLDQYVRGDIAEMIAFVFIPLVFYAIEKTIEKKQLKFVLFGGISYGLLILSHNGVSLMFSGVFVLYSLLRVKKKQDLLFVLFLFVLGLLISAFFWIPSLAEGKYTNAQLFIGQMYQQHFPTLLQLIYSPWGFGSNVVQPGGLSPQIGVINIVMAIASIFVAMKSKKEKRIIFFWLIVFFAAVIIELSVSGFLWKSLSLLRLFEFPWRFTALSNFASILLTCYVLSYLKNKKLFLAIFVLLIISSVAFVKVKNYVSRPDSYYLHFTGTTYYHGEASPIWTAGDPGTFAKSQIELIGGIATIKNLTKKSQLHSFIIDAQNTAAILDNTFYFPGWKATVDNKKVPIEFQDINHKGLITFQVPRGKHTVQIRFEESKIRFVSDLVSATSVLLILFYFLFIVKFHIFGLRRKYKFLAFF